MLYRINDAEGRQSITCLVCGMTSHHPEDVKRLYCGNCHRFHELTSPVLTLKVGLTDDRFDAAVTFAGELELDNDAQLEAAAIGARAMLGAVFKIAGETGVPLKTALGMIVDDDLHALLAKVLYAQPQDQGEPAAG